MLLLLIATLTLLSPTEGTIRCFECTDVPNPRDCVSTTICQDQQKCVVQQYITSGGLLLYSSGCLSKLRCAATGKRDATTSLTRRNSDIPTCEECCDGEFCNNQGCGTVVGTQPQRGPYCFNCPILEDPNACRTVKMCSLGQVCMLHKTALGSASSPVKYEALCETPLVCNTYANLPQVAIGKRSNLSVRAEVDLCHTCCKGDFCNDHCDALATHAPVPTTTTTSTTTTKPPTTTTKLTTTTTKTPTKPPPTTTTTTTTTKPPTTTRLTTTTTLPTTTSSITKATCEQHGYSYVPAIPFCFKFHFEKKDWQEANTICAHEGGTLAVLDTEIKWNFLKSLIENEPKLDERIYIGLSDAKHNDHFGWTDGSRFGWENWDNGQPNQGSDNCVYLLNRPGLPWHDIPCSSVYKFVCTK